MPGPNDNVQTALRFARTRLNDAIQSIGGEVLTDTQAFSQAVTNAAWRRLQAFMASIGSPRYKDATTIYSLPVVAASPGLPVDPATQCWMNWDQFFDGAVIFTGYALPENFISPLRAWERPSVMPPTVPGLFKEMDLIYSDLPVVPKRYRNFLAQWRNNTLVLPGATVPIDLKLYFAAYLPDFIDMGDVPWYEADITIPRAADALAWYIAFEMAMPRGDMDPSGLEQRGQDAARMLTGVDTLEPRGVLSAAELSKRPDPTSTSSVPAVKE